MDPPSDRENTSIEDGAAPVDIEDAPPALPPGEPDRSRELGFGLIALAQFLAVFAVWVGYRPTTVGLSAASSTPAALGLGATAVVAFYLAFRKLT